MRRPIPGFDGYEADDMGQIWKVTGRQRFVFKPHVLTPAVGAHGYLTVRVFVGAKGFTKTIHSLIALAFLGPRPAGYEVRHGDGDKANNRPSNLQWGTSGQNTADTARHGRMRTPAGRGHRRADVTVERVVALRDQGLSVNEIAKRLNVWWGTVNKRLREAGRL